MKDVLHRFLELLVAFDYELFKKSFYDGGKIYV
jgi:hypothetical protein